MSEAAGPSRGFVIGHLVACASLWGSSFLLIKLTGGALSPPVIASARAVLAVITMIAVILWLGQSILPRGREWRDWMMLGTLNGWVPNLLVAYALERMDSGPAALIQASGPLMTAVLAHLLLPGERLTAARIGGLVIGMTGVALLIGPTALKGGGTTLAITAMLGVTLCYALGNIYVKFIPKADPMRLALGQQSASAVFATSVALATAGISGFAPALNHVGALVALGVIATAIPIAIFMRLISAAGPAKASLTGYLVPTFAVLFGVLVLGETLEARQIAGGLIVLAGVGLVTGALRWPGRHAAPSQGDPA